MPELLDVRNLMVKFPAQSIRQGRAQLPGRSPTPESPASLVAVRDLSFSIAPGEVLGLVGESGSGKSVTSLALMRLLPPQAQPSGEITFANGSGGARNLLALPAEEMRKLKI